MIYLRLTKGRWCAIDEADYQWLSQWKWSWHPPSVEGKPGYACRWERENGKRKKIYMHRQIMNCPAGLVVDHQDRNGLNNQRSNLKRVTCQQNNFNRSSKKGKSEFRGVDEKKGKWRARISFHKKETHLGYFKTEEEAARAYDAKAFEMFCEYADLNFPKEYEARIPSEAIPF